MEVENWMSEAFEAFEAESLKRFREKVIFNDNIHEWKIIALYLIKKKHGIKFACYLTCNSNDLWFDFFPAFQENVTWDELK